MLPTNTKLKFKVEDIDCPGCATDMETVLLQVDGILGVTVNYAEETITVDYDPRRVDDKQIVSIINRMGFKARIQPA